MEPLVSGPVQPAHPHALPFRVLFYEHLLRRKGTVEEQATLVFGVERAEALQELEVRISLQEEAYRELAQIKAEAAEDATKIDSVDEKLRTCVARDRDLKYLLHLMKSSALCLSGGGIRSASFCLGILQGLAGFSRSTGEGDGLLDKLDYLSTVSGGGYIGSWLSSWIYRRTGRGDLEAVKRGQVKAWDLAYREVLTALANPAPGADLAAFHREPVTGGDPEPQPVRHLRSYTSFLAPALGITVDSFTLGAIYLRNLVVNIAMLLPLLLALLAAVHFHGLGFQWATTGGLPEHYAYFASAGLLLLAALCAAFYLPSHSKDAASKPSRVWLPILFCALVMVSCWCLASTVPSSDCWRPWVRNDSQSCHVVPHCFHLTAFGVCTSIALFNFGVLGLSIWWSARRRMKELSERVASRSDTPAQPNYEADATAGPAPQAPLMGDGVSSQTIQAHPSPETGASSRTHAEPSERQPSPKPGWIRDRWNALKSWPDAGVRLHSPLVSLGLILLAVIVASLVTSGLLELIQTKLLPWLGPMREVAPGWKPLNGPNRLYLVFALPAILGVLLTSTSLFCALVGIYELEEDREWWGRVGGTFLAIGIGWMLAHAIVFYASDVWPSRTALAGVSLGAVGSALGFSGSTAAGPRPVKAAQETKTGSFLNKHDLLLPAISIVSIGLILMGNVAVERALLRHFLNFLQLTFGFSDEIWGALFFSMGWLGLGLLVNWAINVNIFSLHGMYRMRLMRAFLGASHAARQPDRFTNFDPKDTPLMAELAHDPGVPLHLICTTLNLVGTKETAWRQRKAESFTFSSVCAGGWRVGYVPMEQYSGPKGASLASAMSISGAAFNPNMGYQSSPVLSLLMTIFCVRLGVWMPNPRMPEATSFKKLRASGRNFFARQGPSMALQPLLSEAFGLTDDSTRWVELTDGGHFENLGLYEMVLRRCKNIIVVDSGADPKCQFEDLGNAIRKIRIDLGVPIRLEPNLKMAAHAQLENKYCVIGKIDYGCADDLPGMDRDDVEGRLIYIKAGLTGREPADILQYARTHPTFPHETTVNQFFNESQFESYRHLGTHVIEQIVEKQAPTAKLWNFWGIRPRIDTTFDGFYEAAKAYWGRA